MTITRRDFLNGVALAVVAGMTPLQILQASTTARNATARNPAAYYPPALTGLRGSHPGSFEVAHQMAWERQVFSVDHLQATEHYDLVVVGGGISGLAAAWFYRERFPDARILILENHDDFGGHAKRNEFDVGGRKLLGYGGSESFQSPRHLFSDTVNDLMSRLGVSLESFETAFKRELYPDHGLSRGVFFDREHFGSDLLVAGDPSPMVSDDIPPHRLNARSWREFITHFPLPQADREALIALHEQPKDYLAGMDLEAKENHLAATSYQDFLRQNVGLSEAATHYFRNRTNDFMGLSIDAVAAYDAYYLGLPGFSALGLPELDEADRAEMEEPYIYHFPDGNASLARLLVRDLIPNVTSPAPAGMAGMESIVLAPFNYAELDKASNAVRLRLNSTVVSVRNQTDGVALGYMRDNQLVRVQAKHCVLACYNMMIPHLLRDLPEDQAAALHQNVKLPLVYTKVVLRNWHSFKNLGVHEIYAATQPYSRIKLNYPVDLGGYTSPRDPSEPMGLHLVYVPTSPGSGMSARDQARTGRALLYTTTFEQMEAQLRDQLQRMLGPGGFQHQQDILEITINRWPHGYAYYANSLFDDEEESEAIMELARRPVGRVTIANSDAAWDAYAHAAIDEAYRAVQELS